VLLVVVVVVVAVVVVVVVVAAAVVGLLRLQHILSELIILSHLYPCDRGAKRTHHQ